MILKKFKDKILQKLNSKKPILITAPTGSGKSTYIPYLISKSYPQKSILIIEPRRIAVLSLYNFLKEKMEIGYKIRFNKENINSKVKIMTDGMALKILKNEMNFDFIILDEIHEKNVRMDILIGILKNKFKNKLILMSATYSFEDAKKYLDCDHLDIKVDGYPMNVFYESQAISDYIYESFLKIRKIIKEGGNKKDEEIKKNILVFLPGEEDIHELGRLLKKLPQIEIFKIYSNLSDKEQQKIFEKSNLIKVILSTNICESSITIPGINFVIDSGLQKIKIFKKLNFFGIRRISKESAIQRAGRCNREGIGFCYRLYTKETYESLEPQIPEIRYIDLSQMILILLKFHFNPIFFNFINLPDLENFVDGFKFLENIGAIENLNEKTKNESKIYFIITKFGYKILNYPFDPKINYFFYNCITENLKLYGCILSSFMSLENLNFFTGSEDLKGLINLMKNFIISENKKQFCKKLKICKNSMDRVYFIYKQLSKKYLNNSDEIDFIFNNDISDNDLLKIQKIFCKCFIENLSERQDDGSYLVKSKKIKVYVHPSNTFFKKRIKKIVFFSACSTTKMYAKIINRYVE